MTNKKGSVVLLMTALLAGLAAAAILHDPLARARTYRPAFLLTEHVQEEVNTSAFGLILGEMRASMADLMWIKTERYLHRGVAYRPHLDADAMAHSGAIVREPAGTPAPHPHEDEHEHEAEDHDQAEGPHHHHDHGPLQALVPGQDEDYRGFIGTIHRAVQPWEPPGTPDKHTAGDELIPWYRLLTYSDPHHWRGYMIGAWWLTQQKETDAKALAEAAGFIEEGIRNNPESFQLQLMRGRVQIQRHAWGEALTSFQRAADLAQKIRPAGGTPIPPVWSESDEEDFAAALRYIPAIEWRKLNDPAAARQSVARGLALLPGDEPLKELLKHLEIGSSPTASAGH